MAIKLLEYMGDTAGLSSLQIIISQKADNWGSIGSVKTVIGEMGHWEAPLWELLCGGGRMERAVAYAWHGAGLRWSGNTAVWWTEDAIPVRLMGRQLEACGGVSPSFLRELTKIYISQMACGDDIITHLGLWWIGHPNWRFKVSRRNYAALNG